MNKFDSLFFDELEIMDLVLRKGVDYYIPKPRDGFRLRISELHEMNLICSEAVALLHKFVGRLALRSSGKYIFESDFVALPNYFYSYSIGFESRLQLAITIYANRKPGITPQGISVGLAFDLRDKNGISVNAVNDYEQFEGVVFCHPDEFNEAVSRINGDALGFEGIDSPITADKLLEAKVYLHERWLFIGKLISRNAMEKYETLDQFIDECISIFDAICASGLFFEHDTDGTFRMSLHDYNYGRIDEDL